MDGMEVVLGVVAHGEVAPPTGDLREVVSVDLEGEVLEEEAQVAVGNLKIFFPTEQIKVIKILIFTYIF